MRSRRPDRLTSRAATAIAAGRIAIGIGATTATRPALRAGGFGETDAAARALARMAGGRDIALGLLALTALDDRRALRRASLGAAAVDAVDAVALLGALGRREGIDRAGTRGGAAALAALALGIWVAARLD